MVSGAAVSPSTSADVWDSQERKMNSFHLRWLRSIKIPWQDRLTNSAVVLRASLILLSQVVFFGLAMLDTWNLDALQTNYCMENWQLRNTALVLQWPLQEKPKAVWHRHHQPKGLCWWWRCLNVCHLKRCEDGWVNSTTNTNQKKERKKKRRGQHPAFICTICGRDCYSRGGLHSHFTKCCRNWLTALHHRLARRTDANYYYDDYDYFATVCFSKSLGWYLSVVDTSKQ